MKLKLPLALLFALMLSLSAYGQPPIIGGTNDRRPESVPGMLVTMVTNADGQTQHVEIRNQGDRPIIAFVLKRHTAGGVSPSLIFSDDGIRVGAMYRPLATTFHWKNADGTPAEGTFINYEVTAVRYANGEMAGEEMAKQHLDWAYRTQHDPIINRLRDGAGKMGAPAGVRVNRGEKPNLYYPSSDGTSVFGYSSDLSNWQGTVPEGTESPLVNNRAYCFNDALVPYGYLIGGGAYQFNDGGCGLLYTAENAQLNRAVATGNPFQLQQNVATQAVIDPLTPALYQGYEQCDLYSNYFAGYPGDPVYGTLGDPWIQIQHGGTCSGLEGGGLNNPN